MNKETLRMQMLAGIITENEYKVKLNEGDTQKRGGYTFSIDLQNPEEENILNQYDLVDRMDDQFLEVMIKYGKLLGPNSTPHFSLTQVSQENEESSDHKIKANFTMTSDIDLLFSKDFKTIFDMGFSHPSTGDYYGEVVSLKTTEV